MTIIDWTTDIAERCSHLAGLGKLPPPCAQHSALQALAVLSITADDPHRTYADARQHYAGTDNPQCRRPP